MLDAPTGHAAASTQRRPPESFVCALQVLPIRVWEKNAPQANVEGRILAAAMPTGLRRPLRV